MIRFTELTNKKQFEQLRTKFVERLKSLGYEVGEAATLSGKSGARHTFDIIARRDNGFIAYTVGIDVIAATGGEVELGQVFAFDDKCYDCGIKDRVLIALPKLDSVAARFAQGQRIKVFDEENLKEFLKSPVHIKGVQEKLTSVPETKSELVKALKKLGYRVEEDVTVMGLSLIHI